MQPPLPQRVTELREPEAHQGSPTPRSNAGFSSDNSPSASVRDSPSSTSSGQHNITSSGESHTGPGRPKLELDPSDERAISRLYLLTNITLQSLAEGVQKCGGPARQYVRGLLSRVTGIGEGSDTKLSKLRLNDSDMIKKREQEQKRALESSRQELGSRDQQRQSRRPQKRTKRLPAGDLTDGGTHAFLSQPQVDIQSSSVPAGLTTPTGRYIGVDSPSQSSPVAVLRSQSETTDSEIPTRPTGNFDLGSSSDTRLDNSSTIAGVPNLVHQEARAKKRKLPSKGFSRGKLTQTVHQSTTPLLSNQDSDFRLFYYDQEVGETGVVPVDILLQAWTNGVGDEGALSALKGELPESKAEQLHFVNAVDHRGVSPLHLATAYGYLKTCGFLKFHEADCNARTSRGESIYNFARPALRLAEKDSQLYYRIIQCRQFAGFGEKPPVPSPIDDSYPAVSKRAGRWGKKAKRKMQTYPTDGQDTRFSAEAARDSTMTSSSVNRSIESIDETEPQFGSHFYASPATTIHHKPSVPLIDDNDNGFVPIKPKRQGTLDSIMSRVPYQGLQQKSIFESMANSAMTNVVTDGSSFFPSQGTYQTPIMPTPNRGQPRRQQTILASTADPGSNLQQSMRSNPSEIPAQPVTDLSSQQPAPPLGQFPWTLGDSLRQPLTQPNNMGILGYGYATSAEQAQNVQTDAFDFAFGNLGPSSGNTMHAPTQINRLWYPTSFVDSQNQLQAAQFGYGEDQIVSDESQTNYRQSVPHTTAGAAQHPYPLSGVPQAELSQHGQPARHQSGPIGTCQHGYSQCGGYFIDPAYPHESPFTFRRDALCDLCSIDLIQYLPPETM